MSHPPKSDRWTKTALTVNIVQDSHLDKFIGDAMMVVFIEENHLERATKSALAVKLQLSNVIEISAVNKNFSPKFLPASIPVK